MNRGGAQDPGFGPVGDGSSACEPIALRAFLAALPELPTTAGLVRAASALALQQHPDAPVAEVPERLAAIRRRIQSRVSSDSAAALLAHAHDELFAVEGFAGDTVDYFAPENSYLHRVLARRRGIPISLALVYKAVLDPLGIDVHGIGAPGHFLVRVQVEGAPAYVDPFHGGVVLSATEAHARIEQVLGRPLAPQPDLFPVLDHRAWLRRMLRNLQGVFAQREQDRHRHAMLELEFALLHAGPPA